MPPPYVNIYLVIKTRERALTVSFLLKRCGWCAWAFLVLFPGGVRPLDEQKKTSERTGSVSKFIKEMSIKINVKKDIV